MLNTDAALSPTLTDSHAGSRALSRQEQLQQSRAACALMNDPRQPTCSGQVFAGIFFDGTGNNEKADFNDGKLPEPQWKHSNVARLFYAWPRDKTRQGTTAYYKFYIPGVGTSFPEIGDSGTLGSAGGWGCEKRMLWGLTRVYNALSQYVSGKNYFSDTDASSLVDAFSGTSIVRNSVLLAAQDRLKEAMQSRKPQVEQLNLSVFGFSRGAAQARAFVNWFFELCEQKNGGYYFAGVPVRLQFLGIFDTVASVGVASMFSTFSEGRMSWADDALQIHPGVEKCLHLVAAHEVRACFPLDSVRINGRYPANALEYVYPGVHSDVGGGYSRQAQGKLVGLARIPGYEMYLAARRAGVPFLTLPEIKTLKAAYHDCLVPDERAVAAFRGYMQLAAVKPGPVEEMLQQHMGWYFGYRWQLRNGQYPQRPFFRQATADEQTALLDTQQSLMQVLRAVGHEIDSETRGGRNTFTGALLKNPYALYGVLDTGGEILQKVSPGPVGKYNRVSALTDSLQGQVDQQAALIKNKLQQWQQWLQRMDDAIEINEDAPEKDMYLLIDRLRDVALNEQMKGFFDDYVHDSMAGFAQNDHVNEFLINGFGIAKFRRVFTGDKGDKFYKQHIKRQNQAAAEHAKQLYRWHHEGLNAFR